MNRTFFLLVTLVILLLFLGSSWGLNQSLSEDFQEKASTVYKRTLKVQAELIAKSVSAQALVDDFVNARIQLERLRVNGFITDYRLTSIRSASVQSDNLPVEDGIKIVTPIRFKEDGEEWGSLVLWFPSRDLNETLRLNQVGSRAIIFLNMLILLVVFVGVAFTADSSSHRLTKVVVAFFSERSETYPKNNLFFLLWKPFLRKIEAKAAELRMLKHSNDELQMFSLIANISQNLAHDMRAPLAVFERILFLDNGDDISQIKPVVRQSLSRLNSMIESLRHQEADILFHLVWNRIEFRQGIEELLFKANAKKIVVIPPVDSVLLANLDLPKFERAWVNLASNAIDFAKSEVRIEADTSSSELRLRVIDDGPGVPDEFLPRLFQRGATHGKADGTGLGLAYVRQIMRGHGGDVTYRRENGLTIFECRLPNAVEPEGDQDMDIATTLDIQLSQKITRTVAICLEPIGLSKAILAKLGSFESGDFFFSEERSSANIVVSNVEDIMIDVLERDDQEYVSVAQFKADENRIVELLKKKFNLG